MPKSIQQELPKESIDPRNGDRVRTTNRHPSKITPGIQDTVSILASNIDTLVLSFDILWENNSFFFATLTEAKSMAQSNKKEFPIPFRIDDKHDDYLFNIKEFGSKGYEWILTNQEYSLVIGKWFKPQAMPSVILTIRSETLWRKGPYAAIQFIINFLTTAGGKIQKTRVSRLDLCVDTLFPLSLWSTDILNYAVTRAASDSDHNELFQTHRNHKKLSTIDIGKGKIKVRLYDKPLEIQQRSNKTWFFDIWNLKDVPKDYKVIRVEFQLRREVLKELGIDSIEDLFRLIHNAWSYCTINWLKFQDNPGKQSHQRKTFPWWEKIQNGFNNIPAGAPLIRCKAANADKDRLSQQILGLMSSFAAIEMETGYGIAPGNENLIGAFQAFQSHLVQNNLNEINFSERIENKKAKFQRINTKFLESFTLRKELGFLPKDAG